MKIKDIGLDYYGSLFTVREHIKHETPIASFLQSCTKASPIIVGPEGEYLEISNKFSGYIGDMLEEQDIPVLILGIAEIMTKINLINLLGMNEQKIYNCPLINQALRELENCMDSLSFRELNILVNSIGEDKVEILNERLSSGFIENLFTSEDNQINRALWIFQLTKFRKSKELKWFRYRNILKNEYVAEKVNQLATRATKTLLSWAKNKEVYFFPIIGDPGELTVAPDLKINNSVILFSGSERCNTNGKEFKKNATILNACNFLSDQPIKNTYIYYMKWDTMIKIS